MSVTAKRILVIALPAVLAIALAAAIIYGVSANSAAQSYKTTAEAMYNRAYLELAENLSDLEVSLSKLLITNSHSRTVLLLDDIWRYSGACASLLSQIPASHTDSSELNGFVIRVGDYSRSLAKSVLGGRPFSEDDLGQLNSMYAQCSALSEEIQRRIAQGDTPVEVVTADGYYESSQLQFKGADEYDKFPSLIYDGPFSESVLKAQPEGLTGDDIDADAALEIAREFAGTDSLELASESNGAIPSYDFTGELSDGRTLDISVSVRGGHVVWMRTQPSSAVEGIPDEELQLSYEDSGREFLSAHGYANMEPTYGQYADGAALINYAWSLDGVMVYNDLIKVWLDRVTNEVIGFDARNYLFSHHVRELPEQTVDEAEARLAISADLEVVASRLALIPITPQTEALCHEFTCRHGDVDYIVYVDAQTGEEAEIFKIVHTQYGTLVV
ncbi:MAG: germination protein YpeB [Clostridia bacterium]|nr:germination protein YpeB [Clostridia bacterium]